MLGVKKPACSDWDRSKQSTDKEGADAVGLGAGLISSNKHEAEAGLSICLLKKRFSRIEKYLEDRGTASEASDIRTAEDRPN